MEQSAGKFQQRIKQAGIVAESMGMIMQLKDGRTTTRKIFAVLRAR